MTFDMTCNDDMFQVTMNSVTDYIDTIAFFAFSTYYCSLLYVLTHVTHVTTPVTVCVIWHAEIKGYLLAYLLLWENFTSMLPEFGIIWTAQSWSNQMLPWIPGIPRLHCHIIFIGGVRRRSCINWAQAHIRRVREFELFSSQCSY